MGRDELAQLACCWAEAFAQLINLFIFKLAFYVCCLQKKEKINKLWIQIQADREVAFTIFMVSQ